jgi:hypothetical protein
MYEFPNGSAAQYFTARFVKIRGFRIQNLYEHFLPITLPGYRQCLGLPVSCDENKGEDKED